MNTRTWHLGGLRRLSLALALAVAVLGILLLTVATAQAVPIEPPDPVLHEWVITVGTTGTVSIIDPTTDMVYGPFLEGELGSSGGGLFDVAVTRNAETALISNFGDSTVYFVNISNPLNPSVVASVTLPFFAEDIAIASHGRTALVTDGGFSPLIAVLDIVSPSLAYTVTLPETSAQAVDIAIDGTVLVVDYFGGSMTSLYPDASGQLTVTGVYTYLLTDEGQIAQTTDLGSLTLAGPAGIPDDPGVAGTASTAGMAGLAVAGAELVIPRAVNVAIAPDNQTVLLPAVSPYTSTPSTPSLYSLAVYQILEPGVLTLTEVITGLPRAVQSVAFSPDGAKAYLAGNGGLTDAMNEFNRLMVLDITAPGVVSVDTLNAADFPRLTSSQLFGVDTIDVANGKAYVSYPVTSNASNDLRVVDLADYSVKRLDMPGVCTGVATIPVRRTYFPFIQYAE